MFRVCWVTVSPAVVSAWQGLMLRFQTPLCVCVCVCVCNCEKLRDWDLIMLYYGIMFYVCTESRQLHLNLILSSSFKKEHKKMCSYFCLSFSLSPVFLLPPPPLSLSLSLLLLCTQQIILPFFLFTLCSLVRHCQLLKRICYRQEYSRLVSKTQHDVL